MTPMLFFVGFENEQRDALARDDNQAGLITVSPVKIGNQIDNRNPGIILTFHPNSSGPDNFMKHNIFWWFKIGKNRRRMDKYILGNSQGLVRHAFRSCILYTSRGVLFNSVFADRNLINKTGSQQLSKNLELVS